MRVIVKSLLAGLAIILPLVITIEPAALAAAHR